LGNGEINQPLLVRGHRFSAAAHSKIVAAGGSVEEMPNAT
jgi:ribosomal protein L15